MLVLAAPVGNVFSLRSFKLLYLGGRSKFTGLTQECNPGFLLLRTSLKEGEAESMPSAAVSRALLAPGYLRSQYKMWSSISLVPVGEISGLHI